MPVDPDSPIEITGFKSVPSFAHGFVRDLRPRWALEEIGVAYRVRLIGGPDDRPADYCRDQPFNQVPVYKEGELTLFESGAIVMYIGEKDERLLPREAVARARAIGWVVAALNSIEPITGQLATIDTFDPDAEWAKLRRPQVVEMVAQRMQHLSDWLGDKDWLEGRFTIGDIMMVHALDAVSDQTLVAAHANLADYLARGLARPAYRRALDAQIAEYAQTDRARETA